MENQKYTDFLIHNFDEDDENLKICGKDYNEKNLKVLKNKECPINYIQILQMTLIIFFLITLINFKIFH